MSHPILERVWPLKLPPCLKIVLVVLAADADASLESSASLDSLATGAGLSRERAAKAVEELELRGLISRRYLAGDVTVYRLHLPGGAP